MSALGHQQLEEESEGHKRQRSVQTEDNHGSEGAPPLCQNQVLARHHRTFYCIELEVKGANDRLAGADELTTKNHQEGRSGLR